MSNKDFNGTTHLYKDPYLMFQDIRKYTEETKDTVEMDGVISEWITVSKDQRWLYRPDRNAPASSVKEILAGMTSDERERVLKIATMIVKRDFNLLTQYLNYGDRILKLLSFA